MSNIRPDDFRKHAAEEDFFRLAAMEIESEQNEEFLEAQSLPDPSPEVLQRMQANLQMTMRRTRKRKRRHTIFLHLGRFTACAAVVFFVLLSTTYFGVEAARNSINNFVLELFDGHAIVKPTLSDSSTGALLPINWNGPFNIRWSPSRFTNVQSQSFESSWNLLYTDESGQNLYWIYAWDTSHTPTINIEGMLLISEESILHGAARIYRDSEEEKSVLLWSINDYFIQICGDLSVTEVRTIAENFEF